MMPLARFLFAAAATACSAAAPPFWGTANDPFCADKVGFIHTRGSDTVAVELFVIDRGNLTNLHLSPAGLDASTIRVDSTLTAQTGQRVSWPAGRVMTDAHSRQATYEFPRHPPLPRSDHHPPP